VREPVLGIGKGGNARGRSNDGSGARARVACAALYECTRRRVCARARARMCAHLRTVHSYGAGERVFVARSKLPIRERRVRAR